MDATRVVVVSPAELEALIDRAVARRVSGILPRLEALRRSPVPDTLLTVNAVAKRCGVGRGQVLDWIHAGRLHAVATIARGGNESWRIPPAALEAFLGGESTHNGSTKP